MQSPQKRANGRFKAMIHQIFGLIVEPDADVGAQPPDIKYFVKKIDGLIVLKDILTHGVMTWHDLHSIFSIFVRKSARREHGKPENALGAPERRRLLWRQVVRRGAPQKTPALERRHEDCAIVRPRRIGG